MSLQRIRNLIHDRSSSFRDGHIVGEMIGVMVGVTITIWGLSFLSTAWTNTDEEANQEKTIQQIEQPSSVEEDQNE